MKSGLLGITALAVLSFASLNVSAKAREFRVNKGSVTASGYATAWGFAGMKVDFEKIEDQGKVDEFLKSHGDKMRGYLVDLKTDEVIATLSDEPDYIVGEFGSYHYGNRYGYSIQEMSFDGGDKWSQHLIGVTSYSKWNSSLNELILIKDKSEDSSHQVVALRVKDIQQRLNTMMSAKMTADEKKFFDEAGANDQTLLISPPESRHATKVPGKFGLKFDVYVPKSDLMTELKGVALFKVSVKPDGKDFDIEMLKQSQRLINN